MLYTEVDQNGMIRRRLYTDNADAAVFEGCRLVADSGPSDLGVEAEYKYMVPIEPVPLTATQIEYEEIMIEESIIAERKRSIRNELLINSDWTQLPDAPLTAEQKQQWANYRQQLRDITKQQGFPYETIFPQIL